MTNRRRLDPEQRIALRKARIRGVARVFLRLLGGAALLASAPALVFFGHRFFSSSQLFAINEIEISGISRVSQREVIAKLGISTGDNLFLAETKEAEARLEMLPWVESAEVRLRFPQGVVISVLERVPRALVDLGHLYLADERGNVFKRAMPSDPLDLPVITGLPREEWNQTEVMARNRLNSALEALAIIETHPMIARLPVQQLHLDEAEDLTLVLGAYAMTVHLGQGDLPRKMDRLERVIEAAERKGKRIELARLDNRTRPEWIAARLSGQNNEIRNPEG